MRLRRTIFATLAVFAVCIASGTSTYVYACSIPGGVTCESIEPECDGTYTVEWQGFCCGTQEIPNTCCEFICYKWLCSNGEICGRVADGQDAGYNCAPYFGEGDQCQNGLG